MECSVVSTEEIQDCRTSRLLGMRSRLNCKRARGAELLLSWERCGSLPLHLSVPAFLVYFSQPRLGAFAHKKYPVNTKQRGTLGLPQALPAALGEGGTSWAAVVLGPRHPASLLSIHLRHPSSASISSILQQPSPTSRGTPAEGNALLTSAECHYLLVHLYHHPLSECSVSIQKLCTVHIQNAEYLHKETGKSILSLNKKQVKK